MDIYITQLIYIKEGKEDVFDQFESIAIPAIARYNGKLLFRTRPRESTVIENNMEMPYEIHLASFPSEEDFQQFMQDEERQKFLHLKEASIKSTLLIKGNAL
jgi:uncharacterized protein (DUF1330 family)